MAKLEGQSIAASYDQLLHVDRDGGGNTTTLVNIKDGDNGTTFALQLSTTTAVIDNPTADSSTQGGILRLQSDDGALMQSGSRLGVIEFAGAEDSNNNITVGGRIESVTDNAWSDTENGADMVFYTTDGNASQTEVLRLTADNLVGIGTTTIPHGGIGGANFAIDATNPRIQITDSDDDYPVWQFYSGSHDDTALGFDIYNDNGTWKSSDAGSNFLLYKVADTIKFMYDSGIAQGSTVTLNNGLVLDTAGDVTVSTGDLIMGTSGKGISFAATSDAGGMTSEVLDDYEEGTWDGVVTDGTNPMTMNSGFDEGYYTKVGNLVTVNGYFVTTSLGSASGNIRITGLPFTLASADAAQASGACVGFSLDITAGYSVTCNGSAGGTHINLHVWDATTGCTTMQASEWTANGLLIISFSYRAA